MSQTTTIEQQDNAVSSKQRAALAIECIETLINDHVFGVLPKLSVMSKQFNIPADILNKKFKRKHGEPIYTYFLRKKIEMSKELLKKGTLIKIVAEQLGYKKTSNFIKKFKNIELITPGQWVIKLRASIQPE
jgi:AraC-like DNA-binding protein